MPYAESTLPSDENEDISHILFEKESSVEKEGLSQQDFSSEEEELVENVKISDNQTKIINSSISESNILKHPRRALLLVQRRAKVLLTTAKILATRALLTALALVV
ncbi:hypothetical protein H4Q26_005899, partial [Puccinia striiformis f. sp. tritici PST-130]